MDSATILLLLPATNSLFSPFLRLHLLSIFTFIFYTYKIVWSLRCFFCYKIFLKKKNWLHSCLNLNRKVKQKENILVTGLFPFFSLVYMLSLNIIYTSFFSFFAWFGVEFFQQFCSKKGAQAKEEEKVVKWYPCCFCCCWKWHSTIAAYRLVFYMDLLPTTTTTPHFYFSFFYAFLQEKALHLLVLLLLVLLLSIQEKKLELLPLSREREREVL